MGGLQGNQGNVVVEVWGECLGGDQLVLGVDVYRARSAGAIVVEGHQVEPVSLGDAGQNVAVGRKVSGVDDYRLTARSRLDGGGAKLVKVHGCRIAHQRLPSGSSEH